MIRVEHISVMNLENAIRGMRHPMQSYDKIDSCKCGEWEAQGILDCDDCVLRYRDCSSYDYVLGKNDLGLAVKLCKAGTDHRKFMRQILVSMDITAPLYWYKEFDTYKVGTTANSTSTMHKIHSKPFEINDFSHEYMSNTTRLMLNGVVGYLEDLRLDYLKTKSKKTWYDMIQLLPSSYNQTRTITLNYEVLLNMYHARKNHKLQEWRDFASTIETLPYAKELIVGE